MTTPSRTRPKRRRTSPQHTTGAGTRGKRVRGSVNNETCVAGPSRNERSNGGHSSQSDMNQTSPSVPAPPTPSSGFMEPMSAILARHKAWRKAGAPHDLRCFECHQDTGPLQGCETCRRVSHEQCLPQGGYFVPSSSLQSASQQQSQQENVPPRRWFCPVCVHRGWHVTPPVLTPPQSPVLAHRTESDSTSNNTSTSTNANQQIDDASTEKDAPRRKSRFDTLSPQVESALWVLYRELESVPISQRRIAKLETEMAQLRQEMRIQRNEIELTRASGSQVRSLQEEVQRLKRELVNREASMQEVEALRTRNRELEGEVERSRDEVAESARGLAEWKKKLSSLIGD